MHLGCKRKGCGTRLGYIGAAFKSTVFAWDMLRAEVLELAETAESYDFEPDDILIKEGGKGERCALKYFKESQTFPN